MFYTFDQNNSGGYYEKSNGISTHVIIEANSSDEANEIAEDKGVYFNGVADGIDCECCGDRWYRVNEYDGTAVPMVYNDNEVQYYNVVIYYANGNVERFGE